MRITMRDEQRINIMQSVKGGQIPLVEGSRLLGVTVRQINRLLVRLREDGIRGLIHGNRGKTSPRKTKASTLERIKTWMQGKYQDINDTHLAELLKKEEKISVSKSTLRRIRVGAGFEAKRKRRSPRYRSRRERKEAFGMMIQIDASPHDWLEGRGPWLTLVGGIDDACSHGWAHFEERETTWGYFDLMENIFLSKGLPLSLYSDRHTIFFSPREPTIIEQLKNSGPLTQFGRAMQELGIKIIPAYSPQAKGRIERLWQTLQDRLVVELRLVQAKTLKEANEVLGRFLKEFNQQFAVSPKQSTPVFRSSPSAFALSRILCIKATRMVAKDHTVSFEGLILQIPSSKKFHSVAGRKVEVLQLKDGSIEIHYQQQRMARFSPEAVTRMIDTYKIGRSELKKKVA